MAPARGDPKRKPPGQNFMSHVNEEGIHPNPEERGPGPKVVDVYKGVEEGEEAEAQRGCGKNEGGRPEVLVDWDPTAVLGATPTGMRDVRRDLT